MATCNAGATFDEQRTVPVDAARPPLDTLIYVKDRCTPEDEDAEGRIFVKVPPVSPEDLPADRQRQEVRYVPLRGVYTVPKRFGDRCLIGRSLSTYPVDRIATGQWVWRWEQGRMTMSSA